MKWKQLESQICSVKRSLAILGDRWTLAIIRDAFVGATRFSDFRATLGIPKHRLSDRLSRLVETGILEKRSIEHRHPSYHLTEKGRDLLPVLVALAQWGDKHTDDGDGPPLQHIHKSCGAEIKPFGVCGACGEPITPETYQMRLGPGLRAKFARGEEIAEMEVLRRLQNNEANQ